jgi:hypothetical protein
VQIKAKPIQRIDVSEVAVMKTIKAEEPVIILNSFLVVRQPALVQQHGILASS